MKKKCLIRVEFCIYTGGIINYSELTKIIGFEPTNYWEKDELIRNNLKRKESAWLFSTENVSTFDFEDVINPLLVRLKNVSVHISEYMNLHRLKCKFDIVIEPTSDSFPSLFFSREFIELCCILGAEIDTDVLI